MNAGPECRIGVLDQVQRRARSVSQEGRSGNHSLRKFRLHYRLSIGPVPRHRECLVLLVASLRASTTSMSCILAALASCGTTAGRVSTDL
jgi:hypothetical protein